MGMRFEFEKVSVEEARQALESSSSSSPSPRSGPHLARAPVPAAVDAAMLDDATRGWLAEMPATVAPQQLAVRFPRIANEICALWKRPSRCEVYLRDLMLDSRAGREGFPADIMRELGALAAHYAELYPTRSVNWGSVGKR